MWVATIRAGSGDDYVIAYIGHARRRPCCRCGNLSVVRRLDRSSEYDVSILRADPDGLRIEEPGTVERVHDLVADIRDIDLALDADLVGHADHTKEPPDILFGAVFLIMPIDFARKGDPTLFHLYLDRVARDGHVPGEPIQRSRRDFIVLALAVKR